MGTSPNDVPAAGAATDGISAAGLTTNGVPMASAPPENGSCRGYQQRTRGSCSRFPSVAPRAAGASPRPSPLICSQHPALLLVIWSRQCQHHSKIESKTNNGQQRTKATAGMNSGSSLNPPTTMLTLVVGRESLLDCRLLSQKRNNFE